MNMFKRSPVREAKRHDELMQEISAYETQITTLQALRSEALEELAEVKNLLLQNGQAVLEINSPTLLAPMATTTADDQTGDDLPPEGSKKNLRYDKSASLGSKLIWAVKKHGALTTTEMNAILVKQEPDIETKNISTIVGQYVKAGRFERINVNGSKPKYNIGPKLKSKGL